MPGPVTKSSTLTIRSPSGPTMTARARLTMSGQVVSAAGEPLHRLPPTEPRPWICVEPDQVDRLDQPGPQALHLGVLADDGRRGRGPEAQTSLVDCDADELGNALEIDEGRGMLLPQAILDEQVGPACESFRVG